MAQQQEGEAAPKTAATTRLLAAASASQDRHSVTEGAGVMPEFPTEPSSAPSSSEGLLRPTVGSESDTKDRKSKKDAPSSQMQGNSQTLPGTFSSAQSEVPFAGAKGLVHSQSSPGILQQADEANLMIADLNDQLASERLERDRMSQHVKQLEGELRRESELRRNKVNRSASQPAGKAFTSAPSASPFRGPPVPPPQLRERTRGIQLPALRTIPYAPNTKKAMENKAVQSAASSMMEMSRNKELSRQERSRNRIEAIAKLENQGLSNWKERKAEKVARLHDLTVFREGMWGSFFEWHEEYSLT